jgi:GNAT superfamily N-acetyltransferase
MQATIRPMAEPDLPAAQRIVRVAFGTFLGAPDPENFWADFDYVYGRFGAEHVASFTAEQDNEVLGSNFATRWGSVGFFGPLSMRPDRQGQGIAKALVQAVSDQFETWGLAHAGLCTFPQSPLHIALYNKFGFRARFLTPVMTAPAHLQGDPGTWSRYTKLSAAGQRATLAVCRELTDQLYDGLDLTDEIRTNAARQLGDTLLLQDNSSRLAGFAICHWGPASEAGTNACFVKFGAARPGPGAADRFGSLLDAVGTLASEIGMGNVLAGVNLAREPAYLQMAARGFRSVFHTVTMHRPNEAGYSRPDCFVLDDWR